MVTRLTGAILRALLMVLLVVTPYVALPGMPAEATQIVALMALISAGFTIMEYNSTYPSLVEFRNAPPFNRLRFFTLLFIVFALSLMLRGETNPTTLTRVLSAMGANIGDMIDFPYSPVRLVVPMMPEASDPEVVTRVRIAAGFSYLASMTMLAIFVLILRLRGWPVREGDFNVWINLPTFDPTAGGDVVDRLERDAQVNLILGFLLPFIIPAFVKLASDLFDPITMANPYTMIWTMTAWAFLPASLLMRGIALMRVAQLISEQRRRVSAAASLQHA